MNHAVGWFFLFPLHSLLNAKEENIQMQNYRSPCNGILHPNIPMAIQCFVFFLLALLIHQERDNYFLVYFCFDVCC